MEGSSQMGAILFIGVARMYGFERRDISPFVALDRKRYNQCVKLYEQYMRKALKQEHVQPNTLPGTVFLRTQQMVNLLNRRVAA